MLRACSRIRNSISWLLIHLYSTDEVSGAILLVTHLKPLETTMSTKQLRMGTKLFWTQLMMTKRRSGIGSTIMKRQALSAKKLKSLTTTSKASRPSLLMILKMK